MNEKMDKYRDILILSLERVSNSYDKTVLTLSGGALGLSITFVNDILGGNEIIHANYLFLSWIFWLISLASILISIYLCYFAYLTAVKQIDHNIISSQIPGSIYSILTHLFNALGGIFFALGTIFIIIFVKNNLR